MEQAQTFSQVTADASNLPVCQRPSSFRGIILVVEDESLVREATCEILESEGYRVLRARNANEGRDLFRRHHSIISLLITDVVLPGQDGCALSAELRNISAVRTILMSGYPARWADARSLAQAEMFYLPKPFSAESLLEKVRLVLSAD